MISYASIDRIENGFAICEVEMIETKESKVEDYFKKQTKMMDIPLVVINLNIKDIQEGDILVVEHNGEQVTQIYHKDNEEKQRRIDEINKLLF